MNGSYAICSLDALNTHSLSFTTKCIRKSFSTWFSFPCHAISVRFTLPGSRFDWFYWISFNKNNDCFGYFELCKWEMLRMLHFGLYPSRSLAHYSRSQSSPIACYSSYCIPMHRCALLNENYHKMCKCKHCLLTYFIKIKWKIAGNRTIQARFQKWCPTIPKPMRSAFIPFANTCHTWENRLQKNKHTAN